MKSRFQMLSLLVLALLLIGVVPPAQAQIWKKVKDVADKAAEREVLKQVDKKVTNAVRCALEDQACIDKARSEGREVELVDNGGKPRSSEASAPPAAAFVNFDFVPGERVLFADDFTRDEVGNFPQRLEFTAGNMEVAEWQGGRWLRGTSYPSAFVIPLPETLPERYTVEMEVVPGGDNKSMRVLFAERPKQHLEARYFQNKLSGGVRQGGSSVAVGQTDDKIVAGTPFPLRIMADGKYVKVYAGGTRVANVPNAELGRANKIWIELAGGNEAPAYVRNIRVAAGGKKLYDALSERGRVATQGIYFDTGSDRIRPESAPTLKEIGQMLKEHADLRLAIEGHTDNMGDDAANQQLSERRAAAVKAYLEKQHGVAASRLESKGMGESKPAVSNDTPEGRQQNRRVELVRM
jgi:OOP family OmpA-OmpF porin